MENIDTLVKWIKESKKTVFFGGAGVSTESGLKDFRSKDGLYNMKYDYPPEEILSHHFFVENPEEFYKFYKDKLNSLNYEPNITHKVLKKLEDKNLLSSIITQNIDGFDTSAGSSSVIELHGTVLKNHCMKCHKFYDAEYVFSSEGIPSCTEDNEIIKPDVVLYEEPLNDQATSTAIKEIATADLLIIGGTSLNVYPAAGFINYFNGKHIVLINKDITPYDHICDLVINDSIGKVFSEIEKELDL
jgi:NAD-dependent deacetylase